ncbi:MAG: hypothetical protein P4L90_01240 [Rhodopila sp.]|nr:hypothetical protein [Rhodopila sp.]
MTAYARIDSIMRGLRARLPPFIRLVSAGVLGVSLQTGTSVQGHAGEVQPGLTLAIAGQAETVFSKARNACDPLDIPDAPARALRTASGTVQLYASHLQNRRLVGPDLLNLSTDCRVVFQGNERDDPAAFDDRAWIASLYTPDGQTIFAAIHNEFQGHRRPALCPSGQYMDCWYNAITSAVSHDEGKHFSRTAAGSDLIAALPYRYDEVTGHHAGYFNPTNMVLDKGKLFMMVFATEARAQKPGNCLLRTDRISDRTAWRGWDGHGFDVTFVDPYAISEAKDAHVCAPVGAAQLRWPVTSLVRHEPTGLFIALMMNGAHDGGVFYATSPDLIEWSSPIKLMDGLGEGAYRCGDSAPIAYPSLIDPRSTDRNFMTIGQSAELFFTRFNMTGCRTSMDRDLIRIKIAISPGKN